MEFNKPISELGDVEKTFLLHVWFPKTVKPLLHYVYHHLKYLLGRKQYIKMYWDVEDITADKWLEFLDILKEYFTQHYPKLESDPAEFCKAFSKGYFGRFFINCLQDFLTKEECKDLQFKNIARVFFFPEDLRY